MIKLCGTIILKEQYSASWIKEGKAVSCRSNHFFPAFYNDNIELHKKKTNSGFPIKKSFQQNAPCPPPSQPLPWVCHDVLFEFSLCN